MTPIVVLLFVPSLILLALAPYTWRHRTTPGAKSFLMLVLAVAAWGICYALQLATVPDLAIKSFWSAAKYVGITITPVVWFVFALEYTGHGEWLTRRRFASLFILPTITVVMAFANPSNLMWAPLRLVTTDQFVTTDAAFGPWFWVHATYSDIFILLGIALLVRSLRRFPQMYQQQAWALVLAALLPLLANAIFILGLSPNPYLDLTPVAFTLSALLFTWALFRYRLLDIVPVARDAVVASMSDVVVVIDLRNRIVDINPAGQQVLGRTAKDIVGQPVERVFSNWSYLVERYIDMREVHEEITLPAAAGSGQSYFDLRVTPISDQRGRVTGRLVVLRDITQGRLVESLSDSEQRMRRRATQLEIVAEVARAITSVRNLADLLPLVVRLISERFDFYHVGIFLLDETGEYAVLQAASSEGGRHMLAEGHKLKVGLKSIVGHVARNGVARMARDVSLDSQFFQNPVLPLTKSEVALPLKVRDQIIGVLDVQSEHAAAFAEDDVALLAILGDQVASAIDNARSFEKLAVLAEENRLLLESSQQALEELNKLTRRLTAEGWEKYFTGRQGELVVEDVMPELATTGKGLASSAQGAFTLPIMLRGEVIGTIDLESSESNQDWSEENISMVKSVAERVGLALDNARLFEETRQRGVELTTLNQIISSASQTLDLHALLDMVLRQTLEAFGFDGGLITVYNETRQKLERIVRTGLPGEIPNDPAEGLENSLCAYVFNSKVPLVIEDFRRGAPVDVSDEIEAGYHSYMGVPLEAKGRVLGTWCGFRKFAGPFSQNTLALLQAVGRQVGFAIENARLFEQTRRRAQREARLSRIAQQLRQATDIDSILQTATEELSQALGTSHAQAQLGVPTSQTDRPNGNGTGGSNA